MGRAGGEAIAKGANAGKQTCREGLIIMRKTKLLGGCLLALPLCANADINVGDIINPSDALLKKGGETVNVNVTDPVGDAAQAGLNAAIQLTPGSEVATKQIEKLGNDVLVIATTKSNETIHVLQTTAGNAFTTIQKANQDTAKTVLKGVRDIEANYEKAWKDTTKQAGRSLNDASDAVQAVERFGDRELKGQFQNMQLAANQVRQGKAIDAMWTTTVGRAHGTEDNFFKSTQESAIIAAAAQSAAAIYGGPAGAAAYAAWATYKTTGDANLALRAGAIAAISSQMGAGVDKMPSGTTGEVLKKSAMAGAAGGIAVAAAGGDEKAITDAFLKSGGAVLVQTGQSRLQAYSPKAKAALDTVQCISAKNLDCVSNLSYVKDAKGQLMKEVNGKFKYDKYDPRQYVGQWSAYAANSPEAKKLAVINQVAQLPKSKVIPLLNNDWVLTSTLGTTGTLDANKPAVVLTYVGPNRPFRFKATYSIAKLPASAATAKAGGPAVATAPPANSNLSYVCPGSRHSLKVSSGVSSCRAIHYRPNGAQEVVWNSGMDSKICAAKAAEFAVKLRAKGISCRVQ